jgi:plasmid stabilization system protein ParE
MNFVWSRRAVRNIRIARAYSARDNPLAAAVMIERIIQQAELLLNLSPGIGRRGRITDTRELVSTGAPYVVVYRILGESR